MNKNEIITAAPILVVMGILISVLMSQRAAAFSSADEYRLHIQDSESCSTDQCHQAFRPPSAKLLHAPLISGNCDVCHSAEEYPRQYGLARDLKAVCNRCHVELKQEIQSSQYIHGPVKSGDCTACHDPHGTEREFLLREPYGDLCRLCHNPMVYMPGASVHKPAQDGNCAFCHDPHASNQRFRLTDIGANLCLSCHGNMIEVMTQGYTHTPLVESGCTDCHDPHSGNDTLRLRAAPEELCFTCHTGKKDEIDHSIYKHAPVFEGTCTFCHSPHASSTRDLLQSQVDTLCYSCHKELSEWKTMKFQHGPVLQGNCTACHDPHGSDNPSILRLAFPEKFYTKYEDGKYSLCFLCHQEAMITVEQTETITSFRNGAKNLHAFHVKQKKGRTCRACHDVHASNEEHHMREEFRFGKMNIPMYYFKTTSGGRCIPGCHKERSYDRITAVNNEQ